tara:strand:- start:4179 stop:4625 length:447 start_codon:yes stop_codon:yes gene_type:complete
MKAGKQVKINIDSNFRTYYGSVDTKKPKSVFINISSWFSPLIENDDISFWDRKVRSLKRKITSSAISSINPQIFTRDKNIIDLDIRTSGIRTGKKSYMNCELTLFLTHPVNIKSEEVSNNIKNITNSILSGVLKENNDFYFTKTKLIK